MPPPAPAVQRCSSRLSAFTWHDSLSGRSTCTPYASTSLSTAFSPRSPWESVSHRTLEHAATQTPRAATQTPRGLRHGTGYSADLPAGHQALHCDCVSPEMELSRSTLALLGGSRRIAPLLQRVRAALITHHGRISVGTPLPQGCPSLGLRRGASPPHERCRSVPPPKVAGLLTDGGSESYVVQAHQVVHAAEPEKPTEPKELKRSAAGTPLDCRAAQPAGAGSTDSLSTARRPRALVPLTSRSEKGARSPLSSSKALGKVRSPKERLAILKNLASRLTRSPVLRSRPPDTACDLARSCRKRREIEKTIRGQEITTTVSAANPAGSSGHTAVKDEKPQDRELTTFEAHDIAAKFNLPPGQVTQAWKLFKRYDVQQRGLVSRHDFQLLMRNTLREHYPNARDVPRELFRRTTLNEKDVTFTEFLVWITETSFSEYTLLTPQQRQIRSIARVYETPVPEVEAIKKQFDRFDTDGSGMIDYREFADLVSVLLGVTDPNAMPESRLKAFWRELDEDCSGTVDFSEFIPWYLGYFHSTGDDPSETPLEHFYRSIRPVSVREQPCVGLRSEPDRGASAMLATPFA